MDVDFADVKPVKPLNIAAQTQPKVPYGNVPAFLLKLWKLVEDFQLDSIISWSQNGKTFKVHDQISFARDVLPKYYKHSNFSSFVRQVNMYGFRKIVDTNSGSLKPDKDEWEFYHQSFQQGKPNLLVHIKRKASTNKEVDMKTQMNTLISEVDRLKMEHENATLRLENMKTENQLLWREVGDLRQQHGDQQTVINKLIQVFIKIVMTNKKDIPRAAKRRALNFQAGEAKFPRTKQDVLPYNSVQTQDLLPYTANNAPIFEEIASVPPDTLYSVESPESPFRLTEIRDDENEQISVVEEAPISFSHDTHLPTDVIDIASFIGSGTTLPAITAPPKATRTRPTSNNVPLVVKNDEKTITVLPGARKSDRTNKAKTLLRTDNENPGFIYPEKYEEKPNTDLIPCASKCLNIDPSQFGFQEVKQCMGLNDNSEDDMVTVLPKAPSSNLTTPETLVPPPPKTSQVLSLVRSPETMVTPTIQIPPAIQSKPHYSRQDSFKDRQEVSDNVQMINRSIEYLQDILEQQPINLDLNNLNLMVDALPENLTVQDIARAIEATGSSELNAITGAQHNGEEPDKNDQPMSPSEYIDPEFGISNSEFFDSVLQQDDSAHNKSGT